MSEKVTPGAKYFGNGRCEFSVWAPLAERVDVHLLSPDRFIPFKTTERGYFQAIIDGAEPGSAYFYRLNGKTERPDPASRYQPQGVHGPSQITNSYFDWKDDDWSGIPLEEYIIYELHVGVFTQEGTFDAIVPHLPELKTLGITAIELMPVPQFPGTRNWGYDGVFLFAVQNSYGGPEGLKRLVNACHELGLAVILDTVYNHLGPEGNCLGEFGPYFTDLYRTPWGPAINFDGPHSDEVKYFFIQNALYWIKEFHIDSLRLDAVHAIVDTSAMPFLRELASSVHELGEQLKRRVSLFAESDRNDTIFVRSKESDGYCLDALWNDDFHHALHVLLTGEQSGYYQDFTGLNELNKAFTEGFVYSGQYSAFRQHRHGISSKDIPAARLVVFAQNHDQVGNRMLGERLSQLVSFEKLKLAAGVVLLSPFIPLLFMGEEYGEAAPFLYFTDNSDSELIEATRQGRRHKFSAFSLHSEPPDPQDKTTFLRCKLNHQLRHQGQRAILNEFYKTLLKLRKDCPALAQLNKETMQISSYESERVMTVRRWTGLEEILIIFNFGESHTSLRLTIPKGHWRKRLDSSETQWMGDGSLASEQFESQGEITLTSAPNSIVLYSK
ncbi:MAG: malto-oligosyltrehalose trehalohydrolase [Chloroflexi bacterium]|nr:malto-oligosyltrehalose trehalohydrolase [Chloroflexota bacterium]